MLTDSPSSLPHPDVPHSGNAKVPGDEGQGVCLRKLLFFITDPAAE